MTGAYLVGGMVAVTGPAIWLWSHRRTRTRVVAELANQVASRNGTRGPIWASSDVSASDQAEFARHFLARKEQVLQESAIASLVSEARGIEPQLERSYVPGHKKGGTVSYEKLCRSAPLLSGIYHSETLRSAVSSLVGTEVFQTPPGDQSSCSLLFYTEAGDHIGWHYDHNFYRGRHFTVLLTLENRGQNGGLSASRLQRQTPVGPVDVDTSPNTLVVFEGARVRHRATPIDEGDQRILLSMTFCADPRITRLKECARRIKDIAFFGVRALWD